MSAILEGKPDKNLILVTYRTHPKLASTLPNSLASTYSETTAYDFANGEMYVRYTESVRGADGTCAADPRGSGQQVDNGTAHHTDVGSVPPRVPSRGMLKR